MFNIGKYLIIFIFIQVKVWAHPMPNSVVVLSVLEKNIHGQIQIPLGELESAIGMDVNKNPESLVTKLGDKLRIYLMNHIKARTLDAKPWTVSLTGMKVLTVTNTLTGTYHELQVDFILTPPGNYDLRNFYFDYDVILHQVASHKAFIKIKQDWQQGIIVEDSSLHQVGVIEWDVVKNELRPFQVALNTGSIWQGFKSLVFLGINHIKYGTDHILFILTLLIPAFLVVEKKRWRATNSLPKALQNILKITFAFTIGHSMTLILGSVHWIDLPVKTIEILIAFSIMVSAVHALKPLYSTKEIWVAGSFGLVHGLAFSETLRNLMLSSKQLFISILGFNIGVELMQIIIILVCFPPLMFLSKSKHFDLIRKIFAFGIILISLFWLIERI